MHDEARQARDTDWPQILALYGVLLRMGDNPVVRLNHAIAAAMVHGPAAGLEQLAALDADPRICASHRLDAVRAHLLERIGERAAAVALYRIAAAKTTSIPERNYLLMRAARDSPARADPVQVPDPELSARVGHAAPERIAHLTCEEESASCATPPIPSGRSRARGDGDAC